MSTHRLRTATPADLDAIVALDRACFDRPWPSATWQAELSRSFCTITLACDDGSDAIVGLACDWCLPPDPAQLLRIATLPAWRGRGVAWDLLCAVIARAQNAGCDGVMLEVGRSNVAARRLYERAAFTTIGVRPGYYSGAPDESRDAQMAAPDDALVMRRTTPA